MQGSLPRLSDIITAIQARGNDAASAVADAVRGEAPVKTGELRDSIEGVSEATSDGIHITVGSDVKQAAFVVLGTAPHEIVPVASKALRFEVAGGIVYAKHVNHPGNAPHDFGMAAAGAIEAIIGELVDQAVAEVSA